MSKPVSKSTQELMQKLVGKSGLSDFQKRAIMKDVKDGRRLPDEIAPNSRYIAPPPREVRPMPDYRYHPKRTKNAIISKTDNYKEEQAPSRGAGPDREKAKNQLAGKMERRPISPADITSHRTFVAPERPDDDRHFNSRFEEITAEIRDRREFLNEMKSLGQGKEYEPIIESQISQLMIELEQVHKEDVVRVRKEFGTG
ncbi:putative Uncharacterized protein family (UPF0193) [Blattamonas nauphoetae]|uniref:Uncharacterized protein n=1 Tax=Blattamonas nauphoetae TaxID=2049346 RepID=A0ABQ9YFX4_9EUKA|nr:putative Uncharacterized protein family (UPF0193) [Blattamonas nauphoetae]